ncbi:MAG: hypothetical protein L6422_10020 [Candidatus Marinimicrobia bacterium]|nr:hypothetical protein [bacterium]MCG2716590.1 hypothetical protein [Candidatus Neomarinimicrobiota bacterium]
MHNNSLINSGFIRLVLFIFIVSVTAILLNTCSQSDDIQRWNKKYEYIQDIKPIVFHYDHGVLGGSYTEGIETVEMRFDDVCAYLGHVCLCGAGGYRIAALVIDSLYRDYGIPERGEFVLISSRDHTISDVIAYCFGLTRRQKKVKSSYFIDDTIETPRREYHYFIGSKETNRAFHVIYKKHRSIGHAAMDSLWKIEQQYEINPESVSESDMEKYSKAIEWTVRDVITGKRDSDLFEIKRVSYKETFSKFSM